MVCRDNPLWLSFLRTGTEACPYGFVRQSAAHASRMDSSSTPTIRLISSFVTQ